MADIDYEHIIANANKGPYDINFNGTSLHARLPYLVIYDVEGRDTLVSDIYEHEYTRTDGARYMFRKYAPKDIVAHYTMLSNRAKDVMSNGVVTQPGQRSRLNELRSILQGPGTENAKIIFADEPDKYWIGTVSGITEEKITYDNTSQGDITIRLSKPFKYSTAEYTVPVQYLDNNQRKPVFAFQYNGTYKAFPTFTATFPTENVPAGGNLTNKGDCGYIAFMNQNGKVLQFGDPDETNLDSKSTNTNLINQKFNIWDQSASVPWSTANHHITSDNYAIAGSVTKTTRFNTDFITPSGYGSGSKWHGPSLTYTLPSNDVTDFTFEFGVIFAAGGNSEDSSGNPQQIDTKEQEGQLRAIISNDNGIIAEICLSKPDKTSVKGKTYMYTPGRKEQYNGEFNFGTYGPNFGWKKSGGSDPKRTCKIIRKGNTFSFAAGGTSKTYTSSAGASYTNAKYVTFWMGSWGTNETLGSIGLTYAKFSSDHWATNKDMKNQFGSNDVCTVDCENATVYLNNIDTPSLGAVGNNWEEFYLSPGGNQIGMSWSSWVTVANSPTFTIKYREVFL